MNSRNLAQLFPTLLPFVRKVRASILIPLLTFAAVHFTVGRMSVDWAVGKLPIMSGWGNPPPTNPIVQCLALGLLFLHWLPMVMFLYVPPINPVLIYGATALWILVFGYIEAKLWRKLWKRLRGRENTQGKDK